MDMNARLEKLERENRLMKKVGIVAAVFAAVLFISGQAKTNKSPAGAQKFSLVGKAVVEANEFRLLDSAGKVRAEIFFPPDSNDAKLLFRDADGNTDAELGASSSGRAYLNLGKQPVVERISMDTGIPESVIGASLALGNRGNILFIGGNHSSMGMYGSGGAFRVEVEESFGGPSVTVADKEGYASTVGRTDLESPATGGKERTPAASVVLFGKDKKVLWSAP